MHNLFVLLSGLLLFVQGGCKKKVELSAPKIKEVNWNSKGIVYSTTKGTNEKITPSATIGFEPQPQPLETDVCVFLDPDHQFQRIIGFGGALTDAAAETFAKLPQTAQDSVLTAYYDTLNGIGYTFGRTNINSCDFSSQSYTYVNDNDVSLQSFSIDHDLQYRVPFIKRVNDKLNGGLTLLASPWSPPAWMKDNNNMLHGGRLKPEFYPVWADYFVRFIQAYRSAGVPVWGVTVQNEPMNNAPWESCLFSAEQERDFIKNALGPAFEKNGLSDKKIMVWDQNRDLIYQYVSTILSDPQAAKYVWGAGIHWYETWTNDPPMFDNVLDVNEAFPDLNLLFTEGSMGLSGFYDNNPWDLGELYGNNILNDLNNGVRAWCDWNMLLDQNGGPSHVGNSSYAPIMGNTGTGNINIRDEFYYIGQFSKFIRPGAKRIAASSNRSAIQTTAFINTNGKIIVVVLNRSDNDIYYHIWSNGYWAGHTSNAHSIQTIIIE